GRYDDRYPATNEVSREFRQPRKIVLCPAVFDSDVLAVHVSGFAQAASQPRLTKRPLFRRRGVKEADHRHRLRARRDRPYHRRAAEKGDEVAPRNFESHSSRPAGPRNANNIKSLRPGVLAAMHNSCGTG